MKYTSNHIILVILCLFVFVSCKKDTNPVNAIPPVTSVTNDSNYLDKIFDIYDDGTGVDTQDVSVFNYDNLKRLTTVTSSQRGSMDVISGATQFYYINNDTLPFKSTEFWVGSDNTDTLTKFFFYNGSQKRIKDSSIHSYYINGSLYALTNVVVNYSYAPGKMYGYTLKTNILPTTGVEIIKDTATLDANNNIISNVRYQVAGVNEELMLTSTFTYDNHPGIYANLSALKVLHGFPDPEAFFVSLYNNPLSEDHNQLLPFPEQRHSGITYEYLPGGYPSAANFVNAVPTRLVFVYKTL